MHFPDGQTLKLCNYRKDLPLAEVSRKSRIVGVKITFNLLQKMHFTSDKTARIDGRKGLSSGILQVDSPMLNEGEARLRPLHIYPEGSGGMLAIWKSPMFIRTGPTDASIGVIVHQKW